MVFQFCGVKLSNFGDIYNGLLPIFNGYKY